MTPPKMIKLWGRTLQCRHTSDGADMHEYAWTESPIPFTGPPILVNYTPWRLLHLVWSVQIIRSAVEDPSDRRRLVISCTGPTFEGCVAKLEETGLPGKWFGS